MKRKRRRKRKLERRRKGRKWNRRLKRERSGHEDRKQPLRKEISKNQANVLCLEQNIGKHMILVK